MKSSKSTWQTYLLTLLQGIVMGIAEIIPGVSGSTLALAMGIYNRFIDLLHDLSEFGKYSILFIAGRRKWSEVVKIFKKIELRFGITLVFGMLIAIAALSNVMHILLEDYSQYLTAFFFGLVIAASIIPILEMKGKSDHYVLAYIPISAIFTFFILGINPIAVNGNPPLLYIFIAGIFAISGLLLPGVSGSFILLMLGLYEYIISVLKDITKFQVSTQNLINILVFILGLIVGFTVFVRILKYLYAHYKNILLAVLSGIMIGSLRVIYPFFSGEGESKVYFSPVENVAHYETPLVWLLIGLGIFIIAVLVYSKNKSSNVADPLEVV